MYTMIILFIFLLANENLGNIIKYNDTNEIDNYLVIDSFLINIYELLCDENDFCLNDIKINNTDIDILYDFNQFTQNHDIITKFSFKKIYFFNIVNAYNVLNNITKIKGKYYINILEKINIFYNNITKKIIYPCYDTNKCNIKNNMCYLKNNLYIYWHKINKNYTISNKREFNDIIIINDGHKNEFICKNNYTIKNIKHNNYLNLYIIICILIIMLISYIIYLKKYKHTTNINQERIYEIVI
ncbi:unknown similar to AMEVITR12 [Mythimna separata entomopoxvirus 'L']|uniref:Uncharacterized protein n=1 Tax=Mythimna separata entomopoxvirus 'L' TaxID=1293572 RepID=A0A916KQ94_9POXV|nr:unknown similar to AMEVITR12 [Mythimna separata entomopoxvirus 'L']CCU56414.1 unknown similar to AMEVITR12 [Mythimna separata entomopoxvirus 'L']